MAGIRMATPLLALTQGVSSTGAGALAALIALSQVVLALPAGRLADRTGLRKPIRASAAAASAGVAAVALFPVFPIMCAAALVVGGTTVVALAAIQRHAGRAARHSLQLKQAFGWLSTGSAIANFVGPLVAGLLIDHAGDSQGNQTGYRVAFAVLAVFPLLGWCLILRVVEQKSAPGSTARNDASITDLVSEKRFKRLMLVNCLLSSCWDVHSFAVPLLGFSRGMSAGRIGLVLGAFAIAAAAIRMLVPIIASRLHEGAVLTYAMIAATLLFFLYPLTSSSLEMSICSVLLGLVLGMEQPMVMSMLIQVTPAPLHGRAIGLRLMINNGASVLAPVLLGSLGGVVGIAAIFWLFSGILGVGSRSAWSLGRSLSRVE